MENFDLLSERVELSEVGDIQGEDVHVGVPVGEVHQLLGLEMVDSLELSITGNPSKSELLMRLLCVQIRADKKSGHGTLKGLLAVVEEGNRKQHYLFIRPPYSKYLVRGNSESFVKPTDVAIIQRMNPGPYRPCRDIVGCFVEGDYALRLLAVSQGSDLR